jgi:diaminopimelate epimerase
MELDFTKMHGAGNDFIMVENLDGTITLTPEEIRALCDRHFCIGADGVILVERSPRIGAAGYMHYFNSDGTLAQMCGNGVRCFAKYLVDRGIGGEMDDPQSGHLLADTLAGPRPLTYRVDADGKVIAVTVDMGAPILTPVSVPTTLAPKDRFTQSDGSTVDFVADAPIETPYGTFEFTCISMGNPHAITFIDHPENLCIEHPGPLIEQSSCFPEKSNIEFARVDHTPSGDRITMRVWERGCGETLACGTGACATAVAAVLTKRAERSSTVVLRGGELSIHWDEATGHVFMTGPAAVSYHGAVVV